MGRYRILVVDDEEFMLRLCVRVLGKAGYEVIPAATLAEAREKIRGSDGLHLLVTDIHLADGHGAEVAAAFLGKFPGAGVLVITAFSDLGSHREEFTRLGLQETDMLGKPFDISRLEDAVRARLPGVEGPAAD